MDEARTLQLLFRALNQMAEEWTGTKEQWEVFLRDKEFIGLSDDEYEELDERGLLPKVP